MLARWLNGVLWVRNKSRAARGTLGGFTRSDPIRAHLEHRGHRSARLDQAALAHSRGYSDMQFSVWANLQHFHVFDGFMLRGGWCHLDLCPSTVSPLRQISTCLRQQKGFWEGKKKTVGVSRKIRSFSDRLLPFHPLPLNRVPVQTLRTHTSHKTRLSLFTGTSVCVWLEC